MRTFHELIPVPLVALLLLAGCQGGPASSPSPTGDDTDRALQLIGPALTVVDDHDVIAVTGADPWSLTPVVSTGLPPGAQLHGEWTPDGSAIVFAVDDTDGTRDLWTVTLATGQAQVLVDCTAPCVWTDEPSVSPDGLSVAYIEGDALPDDSGQGTLRTIPLEGGVSTVVYTTAPALYPMSVAWSPDGSRWVIHVERFASTSVSDSQLIGSTVGIVDGAGDFAALTEESARLEFPDWSPDGSSILASNEELWVIPVTEGGPVQLTHLGDHGGIARLGTYSADGTIILFNVEEPAGARPLTAVMDAAGGEFIVLGAGTHPQLQP